MRDSLNYVVFQHCHKIEQEFSAAIERLEKETTAKTNDLLPVLGRGAICSPVNDKADNRFLMKCSQPLKEWTEKTFSTVVNSSNVDLLTHDQLFAKVKGKPNCSLFGVSSDSDVFGAFYSVAVTGQEKDFNNHNLFAFSF